MADFKWAVVTQVSPLLVRLDGTSVSVPAVKPTHVSVAADQRVLVTWVPPSTVVQGAF